MCLNGLSLCLISPPVTSGNSTRRNRRNFMALCISSSVNDALIFNTYISFQHGLYSVLLRKILSSSLIFLSCSSIRMEESATLQPVIIALPCCGVNSPLRTSFTVFVTAALTSFGVDSFKGRFDIFPYLLPPSDNISPLFKFTC